MRTTWHYLLLPVYVTVLEIEKKNGTTFNYLFPISSKIQNHPREVQGLLHY